MSDCWWELGLTVPACPSLMYTRANIKETIYRNWIAYLLLLYIMYVLLSLVLLWLVLMRENRPVWCLNKWVAPRWPCGVEGGYHPSINKSINNCHTVTCEWEVQTEENKETVYTHQYKITKTGWCIHTFLLSVFGSRGRSHWIAPLSHTSARQIRVLILRVEGQSGK